MSNVTIDEARKILDIVIGPEDIAAKVPELKFGSADDLLKANELSALPPLPSKEKLEQAKEQKKALIFRVGRDAEGKPVTLIHLKERFGALIYSSWFLKPAASFAAEPLQAGWALVDLDPMPGSEEHTYEEQIAFAKEKQVQLKSPAADAYDLLLAFKATGKYYRDCPHNGRTSVVIGKQPVKISHFDKGGMCISTGWGATVKSPEIGAATEMILA